MTNPRQRFQYIDKILWWRSQVKQPGSIFYSIMYLIIESNGVADLSVQNLESSKSPNAVCVGIKFEHNYTFTKQNVFEGYTCCCEMSKCWAKGRGGDEPFLI